MQNGKYINLRHLIITPVFNESKLLPTYLDSIISQTYLPFELILVDDNSTDHSAEIIKSYSQKFSWIKYIFKKSEGRKSQGGKIVNAFYEGLRNSNVDKVDFISKIDADLELPPEYFEIVANRFSNNSKLGIVGGRILEMKNGKWVITIQANYFVRGALKSYRKSCFQDIGGLKPVLGWDGLDLMTALYKNWQTEVIPIDVKHFRPSSDDYNLVNLNFKLGEANFQNGSNTFLAIIRAATKSWRHKNFSVGISFLKGYFSAKKNNLPLNVDNGLKKFINQFHLKRIFKL